MKKMGKDECKSAMEDAALGQVLGSCGLALVVVDNELLSMPAAVPDKREVESVVKTELKKDGWNPADVLSVEEREVEIQVEEPPEPAVSVLGVVVSMRELPVKEDREGLSSPVVSGARAVVENIGEVDVWIDGVVLR